MNPASHFTDDSQMPKQHIVENVPKDWDDTIMAYFKVLSQHWPGGTKEGPDIPN